MKSEIYICRSRKYDLCIFEKFFIAGADPNVLLNKSDDFFFQNASIEINLL